jgi:hypothetical protein
MLGGIGMSEPKCEHASYTGVDANEGPDKVWRCDGCGELFKFIPDPDIAHLYRAVSLGVAEDG